MIIRTQNKIWIFLLLGFVCSNIFAQKSYDFDSWPGKNKKAKTNIEMSNELVLNHNMHLTKGSTNKAFLLRFSYKEDKNEKLGILQVAVSNSAKDAHLALFAYLESLNTPFIDRLNNDVFQYADIAFGQVFNGVLRVSYVRNNIFIVIHAPLEEAINIAINLDDAIKRAPEWKNKNENPSFKIE